MASISPAMKKDLEARLLRGELRDRNAERDMARAATIPAEAPKKTPAPPRKPVSIGEATAANIPADMVIGRLPAQEPEGEMNLTEAAYAGLLEIRKRAGLISQYDFESVKLKVGIRAWYTPDFRVIMPDGRIFYIDVKAFRVMDEETGEVYTNEREDAIQKMKATPLLHRSPVLVAFGRNLGKGRGYEFRQAWIGGFNGGIEWEL